MDSLLNRNLDVTLLVGGLGYHYGLRHRDLNELRNYLTLNALLGSAILVAAAILGAAELSAEAAELSAATELSAVLGGHTTVTVGSRSRESVGSRSCGHFEVFELFGFHLYGSDLTTLSCFKVCTNKKSFR